MKISIAQTIPLKGDIAINIEQHLKIISLAVSNAADIIIFPELSLTGYEPELANELATDVDDLRLNVFQEMSNAHQVMIGVGLPLKNNLGVNISMIIFHPHQVKQIYYKKYLHQDEYPYFVSGENTSCVLNGKSNVGLAICYEVFVPEHVQHASSIGSDIYIASVAKSLSGIDNALKRLSDIAHQYAMTIFMSNCVGQSGDGVCAGKSSVWNTKGELAAQLDGVHAGVIVFDTETQQAIKKYLA